MSLRVLLVGGSSNLLNGNDGFLIDSYDKVVRFNGGIPAGHERQLGSRTDYWSFSTKFADQYNRWKITGAVPMLLNMRIEYPITPANAIYNDAENYKQLRDTYKHPRPSTGLVTAHYIAKKWACDLYCIGFDFFESETWYTGPPAGVHSGQLEREYMESLGVTIL